MELMYIFKYLGFYTKVYDSKEKYDNNEHVDLLFMDKLPKNNIDDRLPLSILFKMYDNVNFNNQTNIANYIQTLKYIRKLDENQTEYIIYIDNWGSFRRIIIYLVDKIVLIKNMYY